MALQLGALRDALEAAQGVTAEMARKAAEEVAAYDSRFGRIESDLAEVKGDLKLIRWQVAAGIALAGAALAANGTTLWFVLRLVTKLGA